MLIQCSQVTKKHRSLLIHLKVLMLRFFVRPLTCVIFVGSCIQSQGSLGALVTWKEQEDNARQEQRDRGGAGGQC